MFNFEYTKLKRKQLEQLANLVVHFKSCTTNSKFNGGINKVELILPVKAAAVFRNQPAIRILLQLQEKIQQQQQQ